MPLQRQVALCTAFTERNVEPVRADTERASFLHNQKPCKTQLISILIGADDLAVTHG
jgi:hypothetical protein